MRNLPVHTEQRERWHLPMAMAMSGVMALILESCQHQPLHAPEPGLERMVDQAKVLPFSADPLAAEDPSAPVTSAMRAPPAGVVDRNPAAPAATTVTVASLERGRIDFDTVCAACHGLLGDGNSPVSRRMQLVRPRNLDIQPVLGYGRERLVRVIETGYGLMPSLAAQLGPEERWEVAGYVKALQLSRGIRLLDLPPEMSAQAHGHLP